MVTILINECQRLAGMNRAETIENEFLYFFL
jgi:hypothetical protein